jgi:hypothetical protein
MPCGQLAGHWASRRVTSSVGRSGAALFAEAVPVATTARARAAKAMTVLRMRIFLSL